MNDKRTQPDYRRMKNLAVTRGLLLGLTDLFIATLPGTELKPFWVALGAVFIVLSVWDAFK